MRRERKRKGAVEGYKVQSARDSKVMTEKNFMDIVRCKLVTRFRLRHGIKVKLESYIDVYTCLFFPPLPLPPYEPFFCPFAEEENLEHGLIDPKPAPPPNPFSPLQKFK